MQPINIKTSAANKDVVSRLTQKLPGDAKENIIARIALGFPSSQAARTSRESLLIPETPKKPLCLLNI